VTFLRKPDFSLDALAVFQQGDDAAAFVRDELCGRVKLRERASGSQLLRPVVYVPVVKAYLGGF
jgi:hypothetical protein